MKDPAPRALDFRIPSARRLSPSIRPALYLRAGAPETLTRAAAKIALRVDTMISV